MSCTPATDESGERRDSMPRKCDFQPGASRRESKWRVVPDDAAGHASDARSAATSRARRSRSARVERRIAVADEIEIAAADWSPTRDPAPTTSVRKRKRGPSDAQRGERDRRASRSTPEGASAAALCWKTTCPSGGRLRARRFGGRRSPARASAFASAASRSAGSLPSAAPRAGCRGDADRDDERGQERWRPRLTTWTV